MSIVEFATTNFIDDALINSIRMSINNSYSGNIINLVKLLKMVKN